MSREKIEVMTVFPNLMITTNMQIEESCLAPRKIKTKKKVCFKAKIKYANHND